MDKTKKLAITLLKLWIACVLIYSVGSSVYISYQQVFVGNDPTVFVSGYHWVTFGVYVLFFLPMLYAIYRLVKKANMEKLRKVVVGLLIWLLLTLGIFLLCVVLVYAAPGLFSQITSLLD